MKALWRVANRKPGMLSLGTGDPHFSLFPMKKVQFEVASASSDLDDPVATWTDAGSDAPTQWFSSSRDEPGSTPFRAAMAYGTGAGLPEAQRAVTELTKHYHAPRDHVCTLTIGNMDGVSKLFRLLGSPGDHFLADEFSFNALTNAPLAHGISWVPVRIDQGGLIPADLERVMSAWDESVHGRRPHVLYTVPSGQNPTGCTLSPQRRKQIYELCQRFDILIIEDDPYYYLQYVDDEASSQPAPSFLSMDLDGRVLRVDNFSKVMMPGMRLGWVTSSDLFHQHLIYLNESSTQHPHGFGQIFITEMLSASGWGLAGFDRWTRSLRKEYQRRRDVFLAHFAREVASTGFARADAPPAGMFVWVDVHVQRHPRFRTDLRDAEGCPPRSNVPELMDELFERCLDAGVVVMPASIFATPASPGAAKLLGGDDSIQNRIHFLRTTFAGEEAQMQPALHILGQVLRDFFTELK
ncbi:PLP-dependent aminotransferase family protein [Phanerochaete sordida]|uniref:PLP-dependent aminotransferase family protein n=1 Tax=Phanerochaete sordida TaxID=48140 RepID=A0A9P3GL54_9APHY|nr:PLP-dependent aminotransferase family protein [Phanerochaete sordida]